MEVLPAGGTRDPLRAEEEEEVAAVVAGHPAGEGDEEPQPPGRTSRTASLVSGLLTELYSCTEEEEVAAAAGGDRACRGRPPRSDSLDSSTETSGSDAFLGGRGVGDSRVLQELRQRPSLRLQMQYLRRKGELLPGGATCPPAPSRPPAFLRYRSTLRRARPQPTCPPAPPVHLGICATCPPAPVAHLSPHLRHLDVAALSHTRRVWTLSLPLTPGTYGHTLTRSIS